MLDAFSRAGALQSESGLRITADLEVRYWNFLPVAGSRLGCGNGYTRGQERVGSEGGERREEGGSRRG